MKRFKVLDLRLNSVSFPFLFFSQRLLLKCFSYSGREITESRMSLLSTKRRTLENESCSFLQSFRESRVENVLEHSFSTIKDDSNITKILFLDCGDLMSVLTAASNTHLKNIHIYLNSHAPTVLARNILILKAISAEDFNPENKEDITFLWDLWYNLEWPVRTKKRFQKVLNELLVDALPEYISIPKDNHLKQLRKVWSMWSTVVSKSQAESKSLMERISKERQIRIGKTVRLVWSKEYEEKAKKNDLFSTAVEGLVKNVGKASLGKIDNLNDSLMQKIHEEIRDFLKNGNCRLEDDSTVCVNPTMLLPNSLKWENYPSCPFDGYRPFTNVELDKSLNEKILIRSCQKILKNLVSTYRQRMDSVKVIIFLEESLEYCYTEKSVKFDVIQCCSLPQLVDVRGLPNLIVACNGLLADHPEAVLFTKTSSWSDLSNSLEEYIEDVLCCPLSMMPTIYGLRLAHHVKLGFPSLTLEKNCRQLAWKKAAPFENVILSPSPAVNRCLDQLAKKCFALKMAQSTEASQTKHVYPVLWYTPLTFHYVVSSLMHRIGLESNSWLQYVNQFASIPPAFQLATRTQEAWRNGQPVLKLTAKHDFNSKENFLTCDRDALIGSPMLRFVLIPIDEQLKRSKEAMPREWITFTDFANGIGQLYTDSFRDITSTPDIHIIDNFHLEMKKTSNEDTVAVSFLLLPDHGIGKTHIAFLLDLNSDMPVFVFKSVGKFQSEEYLHPHPFALGETKLQIAEEENKIRVGSCFEYEDEYHLKIIMKSSAISDIEVVPCQPKPFESVLPITQSVTISHPEGDVEPLTMSFPHPVIVEDVSIIPVKSDDCSIRFSLKKGLMEPWPCEIQASEKSKWIADNLKPWKVGSKISWNSTQFHLNSQFDFMDTPSTKKSPLHLVRKSISELFLNSSATLVEIQSSPEDLWRLKIHRPILTSPTGDPILIVTALDSQIHKVLAGKRKQKGNYAGEEFERIICSEDGDLMMFDASPKEMLLWRFILHLNSTKMVPSKWQKSNVPLGGKSPWLATFISPLYHDLPFGEIDCGFFLTTSE